MTGILFIARLGSTRLPNKHLIEVNGITFMRWLLARFAYEFKEEIKNGEVKLIIATSEKPENKKFETILKKLPASVFYGNDENIPLRQIECGEKFGFTNIISIDGDDILCSVKAARKIYNELKNNLRPLVKSIGLPFGMNAIGYTLNFIKESLNSKNTKLETGWGRIFDTNSMYSIKLGGYETDQDLRFTLDYQEDASFFEKVISFFGEKIIMVNDEELIDEVKCHRFFEINQSVHKEYWRNFNLQQNQEGF